MSMMCCSNILNYILFADGSYLYRSSTDVYDFSNGNQELIKISNWIKSNKLTLDLEKTHHVMFVRKNKRVAHIPSLIVNNKTLLRVAKTNFLYAIADSNLNWCYHINHILAKLNKRCYILYQNRTKI